MRFQGLRKTKVLKTAEDVLEHSYGRKAEAGKASPAPPPPAPPPPAPPPPAPPPVEVGEEEETQEEYAARLVEENKKDDLIAMADERELDSTGNKDDIAARIAEYDYSEE
jgi:hypothetical protein